MLSWNMAAPLSLQSFLIPMAISCTGAVFLIGSSASAALEPFPSMAGTASAAFGSLQFGVSALIGSLLMAFPVTSTIPYGITIVIIGVAAFAFFAQREKEEVAAAA